MRFIQKSFIKREMKFLINIEMECDSFENAFISLRMRKMLANVWIGCKDGSFAEVINCSEHKREKHGNKMGKYYYLQNILIRFSDRTSRMNHSQRKSVIAKIWRDSNLIKNNCIIYHYELCLNVFLRINSYCFTILYIFFIWREQY